MSTENHVIVLVDGEDEIIEVVATQPTNVMFMSTANINEEAPNYIASVGTGNVPAMFQTGYVAQVIPEDDVHEMWLRCTEIEM